jgi:bifunctional DNA-binding transcriptional regulator/antitoxin component of YhaV-PrlF toxin-antitoxin module
LIVSHDPTVSRHVDRVVAIRDGMLASETIRQSYTSETLNGNGSDENEPQAQEASYAELVVLDRAGRVHIPQEYLEQFSIQGRAQLELTEEGILIRPASQTRTEQIKVDGSSSQLAKLEHTGAKAVERGTSSTQKRGLFGRFGRKK